MSFFTPERMCGYMLVGYTIAYGFRLNFIKKVKTRMDDYGVCSLYFRERSIRFGSSLLHFFLHFLYYLFLLFFPILFAYVFYKEYDYTKIGFVFIMFYSAEFVIEKLFYLLEKHIKYEALMFCILHLVSAKANNKNVSDKEKIEYIKNEIPWKYRYMFDVETILEKHVKKVYPWL